MDFLKLARERYSVRKFKSQQVEQEKIDKILKAIQLAPTAKNSQAFKVFLFSSKQAKQKLDDLIIFPFMKEAPLAIAIGAFKTTGYLRKFDNKSYNQVDASIAATHMILEIAALGLGTTWLGHFDDKLVKNAFPELNDYDLVGIFPIGYPADDAKPSEMHSQRKSIDKLLVKI